MITDSPLTYIDDLFEDRGDGTLVAKFEDIRQKDNPHMPVPGLKRWCELHKKAKRLVVETTEGYAYTRMWLKGNSDIEIADVREIKVVAPVVNESIQVDEVAEQSLLPKQQPEPKVVEPLILKEPKRKMTREQKSKATSERMKAFHEKRKAEQAKKSQETKDDEKTQ